MLTLTARQTLLAIGLVALATIAGAWIIQYLGYEPCELCYKQRWAYYAAIPLAGLFYGAARPGRSVGRVGLYVLAAIWLASMIFGAYHAGIEWGWWSGPTSCTGGGNLSSGLPDLSKPAVMCDKPAIRIFGLSLAAWNAVISFALMALALRAGRQGSSSVSQ